MAVYRQNSLYLPANTPVVEGESHEGTHGLLHEGSSDDFGDEHPPDHDRNTAMAKAQLREEASGRSVRELHNAEEERRVEVRLLNTPQSTPNLNDLSSLLYTRGRLQELGCSFTEMGELITYGHPDTHSEFDQMLRLGPVYDEQWSTFFSRTQDMHPEQDPDLWPDLRTLKRVLRNEGVAFGFDHQRLTHGDGSEKVMHLCIVFDDLRNMWSAMRAFTRTTAQRGGQNGEDTCGRYDSGGFVHHNEYGHSGPKPKSIEDEWTEAQSEENARLSSPRHIGWRFSDDIDQGAVARYRDSMSGNLEEELQENFEAAISTPLPNVKDDLPETTSPVELVESTQPLHPSMQVALPAESHTRLRHGPSPLQVSSCHPQIPRSEILTQKQNITTPSMVFHDKLVANPRGNNLDSLGLDDTMTAAMDATCAPEELNQGKPAKKKGFKGWWRNIFSRKDNSATNDCDGGGVSPWYIGA
jgi:hypothetical protein